jgi:DNA-binding response OmpR family regulator
MSKLRILLVEDDANLTFLLKNNLEAEGYSLSCCGDGSAGWQLFQEKPVDLCILDVMLPKQDGFSLAELIRMKDPQVPILFLTARTLKEDVYRGFEIGADDYITKPFTIRELLLRIRAVSKRTAVRSVPQPVQCFNLGRLQFDYTSRELRSAAGVRKLSTKENELLRIFCESRNVIVNRNRLLMEVWGNDDYFVSKSLDVYITKLRKLLSEDPDVVIQNYHSIGYKLLERLQRG